MNIFYLDKDPYLAACYHCDKHVVKMILETCQILASVHHRWGNGHNVTYKETHKNHPSTKWAGDSNANYLWLVKLGKYLLLEYADRYGKTHKCNTYLYGELESPPKNMYIGGSLEPAFCAPPACMPDEYKVGQEPRTKEETVESYRNYYLGAKADIAKWKLGNVPDFMTRGMNTCKKTSTSSTSTDLTPESGTHQTTSVL